MSLHEPQFRLVLYIRLARHQPWMSLGWRNLVLAGQVEKPRKLARPADFLFSILVHLDPRLADNVRHFSGDSCDYARWGERAKTPDVQGAIRMFGT